MRSSTKKKSLQGSKIPTISAQFIKPGKKKSYQLTETELEVFRIIEERWQLGREKYGEGISYKQAKSINSWISEAIEEAADMLQYLVAFKLMLKNHNAIRNRKTTSRNKKL